MSDEELKIGLIIEPTDEFVIINGVTPARVWAGTTARGQPCRVFVTAIQVPEGSDFREFDEGLRQVPVVVEGGGADSRRN